VVAAVAVAVAVAEVVARWCPRRQAATRGVIVAAIGGVTDPAVVDATAAFL